MPVALIEAGPLAKNRQGTEIEISGYIIPITGQHAQSHFMFSRFPQHMCFFCGKAGPESAMQVFTKNAKKLTFTSEKISLKGILQINHDKGSGLLYTLTNAEQI